MNVVFAKELRKKEFLKEVPKDKPGFYKWWAPEKTLKLLLDSKHIDNKYFKKVLPNLTTKIFNGKKYYYIYVGIAVKESIRDRLNWHINQRHSKSSVTSGYLSTFRQTVSSLIAGSQYEEVETNNLIDTLIVEYDTIDFDIRSDEAKEVIEKIENFEMENNVLPLNLRGNKRIEVKDFLFELRKARKNSKDNKID